MERPSDAALCGLDPASGLAYELGLSCVLCVVGATREPALGEDADGSRCVRAGRRAAVCGTPTVVCATPTTSKRAPITPAIEALRTLLLTIAATTSGAKTTPVVSMTRAANAPRSHFPFPTRLRWAALGTDQARSTSHWFPYDRVGVVNADP